MADMPVNVLKEIRGIGDSKITKVMLAQGRNNIRGVLSSVGYLVFVESAEKTQTPYYIRGVKENGVLETRITKLPENIGNTPTQLPDDANPGQMLAATDFKIKEIAKDSARDFFNKGIAEAVALYSAVNPPNANGYSLASSAAQLADKNNPGKSFAMEFGEEIEKLDRNTWLLPYPRALNAGEHPTLAELEKSAKERLAANHGWTNFSTMHALTQEKLNPQGSASDTATSTAPAMDAEVYNPIDNSFADLNNLLQQSRAIRDADAEQINEAPPKPAPEGTLTWAQLKERKGDIIDMGVLHVAEENSKTEPDILNRNNRNLVSSDFLIELRGGADGRKVYRLAVDKTQQGENALSLQPFDPSANDQEKNLFRGKNVTLNSYRLDIQNHDLTKIKDFTTGAINENSAELLAAHADALVKAGALVDTKNMNARVALPLATAKFADDEAKRNPTDRNAVMHNLARGMNSFGWTGYAEMAEKSGYQDLVDRMHAMSSTPQVSAPTPSVTVAVRHDEPGPEPSSSPPPTPVAPVPTSPMLAQAAVPPNGIGRNVQWPLPIRGTSPAALAELQKNGGIKFDPQAMLALAAAKNALSPRNALEAHDGAHLDAQKFAQMEKYLVGGRKGKGFSKQEWADFQRDLASKGNLKALDPAEAKKKKTLASNEIVIDGIPRKETLKHAKAIAAKEKQETRQAHSTQPNKHVAQNTPPRDTHASISGP